jgi:hypothetical protein
MVNGNVYGLSMDLFTAVPLMPKAVSMLGDRCSPEEALEVAGHFERQKIVLGGVAAAEGTVAGI